MRDFWLKEVGYGFVHLRYPYSVRCVSFQTFVDMYQDESIKEKVAAKIMSGQCQEGVPVY